MSKDLKPALIRAFYGFMEMEMEGYNIYVDTPENRFEYDPESIWIINPKTKGWIIELEKSEKLWYYNPLYNNFSNWFKEERSVFEQLITMWVEDVINRGVLTTWDNRSFCLCSVEDVLKRGVSTTHVGGLGWNGMVEDVLKRGVSTTAMLPQTMDALVKDVIKRGVSITDHFVDTNNMVM
jgi:hypothetical protein